MWSSLPPPCSSRSVLRFQDFFPRFEQELSIRQEPNACNGFHVAFSASLWSPYARYNGQVFLNVADLIILQHPHAHCTNHETHYLMECARYRWLCPFFCLFRTFGSSHGPLCMFLLPIQKICLTLLGLPKFLDCSLLGTMTCSWQVPPHVMVYLWPFLSRFHPLWRHTG